MNRALSAVIGPMLALVAASVIATPSSGAVNLLTNPGFEDGGGSYNGWFTFGSGVQLSLPAGDNIIRTGVAASKIYGGFNGCPGNPQFNVGGYGQAFLPTVGRVYELSGFSYVSAADTIPGENTCSTNRALAKIVFFNAISGGAEIASNEVVIGDGNSVSNRWLPFSVSAPAPVGALRVEALILYLQPGCDGGAVYVDDMTLTESGQGSEPNLLVNPSFSTSLTGWTTFGNVFPDARSFAVRTPPGSAKMFSTFVSGSPSGMFQRFATTPGTGWRFRVHALNTCQEDPITGTNDNYATARIVFKDAGNNEIGANETVLANAATHLGTWSPNSVTAVAPLGTVAVEAYILFVSPSNLSGAFFFDDALFQRLDMVDVPTIPGPNRLDLSQNLPNPFSLATRIGFSLPERDDVDISVYDVSGRWVVTLFHGELGAGSHHLTWDGKTAGGTPAAAGVYRCVLKTATNRVSRSMVLSH